LNWQFFYFEPRMWQSSLWRLQLKRPGNLIHATQSFYYWMKIKDFLNMFLND
jgi:hypothetical protein